MFQASRPEGRRPPGPVWPFSPVDGSTWGVVPPGSRGSPPRDCFFGNKQLPSSSSGSGSIPLDSGSFESYLPDPPASSLLSGSPHSGTTFDIIGSIGVAITVLVCATVAMERLPWLRRLAKPVVAVGTMSLTAYVGHFVAQPVLSVPSGDVQQSWGPLLMFLLGATLFAAVWSRFFRRGPLEHLVNAATKPATYIR